MAYHLFRVSLTERRRPPLLEIAFPHDHPDRTSFLREIFSQRHDFRHWGTDYTYVFVGEDEEVLAGRLGKTRLVLEPDRPETGYAPTTREKRSAVNLFFDINQHKQMLAVQASSNVGTPKVILSSLINSINGRFIDAPWSIDVGTINDPNTFWDVAQRHKGTITSITFHFIAPNVLGLDGGVSDDMKEVRDRINGRTVSVGIQNPDGLNLEETEIVDGVEYTSQGGGDVSLKKGKDRIYNSKDKIQKISLENDEAISQSESVRPFLQRVRNKLFGR